MKNQFEVWHQRGGDLVATYFTCDEFKIYLKGDCAAQLQVDLIKDGAVYESYWFNNVLESHWGPADE